MGSNELGRESVQIAATVTPYFSCTVSICCIIMVYAASPSFFFDIVLETATVYDWIREPVRRVTGAQVNQMGFRTFSSTVSTRRCSPRMLFHLSIVSVAILPLTA